MCSQDGLYERYLSGTRQEHGVDGRGRDGNKVRAPFVCLVPRTLKIAILGRSKCERGGRQSLWFSVIGYSGFKRAT